MDTLDEAAKRRAGTLPEHMGLQFTHVERGIAHSRFDVMRHHMAPNGFLHAASVIALVDSACGFGCMASRPEGAIGFTTIELKCNFLGTVRSGAVACEARLLHGGRTTQVWDAEAKDEASGKTIALFRCTQMLLYPKSS